MDVVNKGFNYDVANPPSMTIEGDLVGARALANVIIEGSLKDVLVDPDDSDIKKISSIVLSVVVMVQEQQLRVILNSSSMN